MVDELAYMKVVTKVAYSVDGMVALKVVQLVAYWGDYVVEGMVDLMAVQ